MKIPLPMNNVADKMIWTTEMEWRFTVKSAYLARGELIRVGEVDDTYKRIWSASLTERLRMFIWRIYMDLMPAKGRLKNTLPIEDPSCILCNRGAESFFHLVMECLITQ